MESSHVLSCILGYLIGSIPTAFLVVRWKSKVDIRSSGSGNVGAMNSFQVTRSKLVGVLVLLLDVVKGALAVLVSQWFFGEQFSVQATSGVAAVVGHNFPVWLRFRGGRGLATAAGVMLVLSWLFILVWAVLWVAGFALTKHVNAGNTIASAAELVGILVVPGSVISKTLPAAIEAGEFKLFALLLFIVILIKHMDPVREFITARKIRRQEKGKD